MAKLKLKKLPKKPKTKTLKTMQNYLNKKSAVEKYNKELLDLEKKFSKA